MSNDGVPIHDLRYVHESLGADTSHLGDSRAKHLAWCKERALEYIDLGDPQQAFNSMVSDLGKHAETQDHPGIQLGVMLLMTGNLQDMREFIEGFN